MSQGAVFSQTVPAVSASDRPICALVVDAEEDFDWTEPIPSTNYSTHCMRHVRDLQEVVGAYGIVPTYLLTYPVLNDLDVVNILRRQLARQQCDVGVQLHPWVTPPFAGDNGHGTSFSGNLPPGLEERKLVELKRLFTKRFDCEPSTFRSGRYGLGPETAMMLEAHGFAIDTSVAPRTTAAGEGGPDFAHYDYQLFWFGQERRLLEVPLCRSVVGWGGRLAPKLYGRLQAPLLIRLRISSMVTRLRFAERVTLSPEGNDVAAMLRLVRHLRARGQSIFVLSFHSSSLAVGRNPYVRTKADLHHFYDRLSGILDIMASRMRFAFAKLADLPHYLRNPLT